jgi:hypothetical protein
VAIACVAVVALAGCAGSANSGVGHTSPNSTGAMSATTPGSQVAVASSHHARTHVLAAKHLLAGKYEQPALAVSNTGHGIAWLHGYVGSRRTQLAWLDRTADGRRWESGVAKSVTAAAPSSAETFTFLGRTVVGFGATRGIWISRDAGRRWRRRLSSWTVLAVARRGGTVWVAAQKCGADETCRSVVLTTDVRFSRFVVPASQPSGAGSVITMVSAGRIIAAERETQTGRRTLSVTDGRDGWAKRELPCATSGRTGELAGSGGTLWITCLTREVGPAPGEGPDATLRSTDGGRRWINMTRHGAAVVDVSVVPVTSNEAWGLQSIRGMSALISTTDGGARWSAVRAPWPVTGNVFTAYVAFAATSFERAWALAQVDGDQGTYFRLYRTADHGRHWMDVALPVAADLPAAAQPDR